NRPRGSTCGSCRRSRSVPARGRGRAAVTAVVSAAAGIAEEDWAAAVELLLDASSICVLAHVLPDGDALGGCVALAAALRSLGKDAGASWGSEPFLVPDAYAGLPHLEVLSPPSQFPSDPDVVV